MSVDVEAYLTSKGWAYKRAGATDVHGACLWCNEPEGKRGRLYVNVDPEGDPPGLFMCHLCGKKGALNSFKKYYGDPIGDAKDEASPYIRSAILRASAEWYHAQLGDNEDAYQWLREKRGLTVDTIINHQLGWAPSGGGLKMHLLEQKFPIDDIQATGLVDHMGRDFLHGHITIPYHVAGNVVLIRGKDMAGKYLTPSGQKTRLFNTDATYSEATDMVLCEGEFDALVLEQQGYVAVGSPGANVWQSAWTSYFDAAKKVFICFDNDAAGNAGAEKVATALGPKARIVAMPEGVDVTDYLVTSGATVEEFDSVLNKTRGGLLITVREAYQEYVENKDRSGMLLGWEPLDALIKPGLMPGQLMVVLAKTGAGKTIWLINTFQRFAMANPTSKILFLSLEQTRAEWFDRARKVYRFYNPFATDEDAMRFWEDRILIVDKNRVNEEELLTTLDQFEEEMGEKPALVGIDYLGYWSRSYKGEAYERTTAAVMALKAIAKERRIAIITPHQVSRSQKFGEEPDVDSSRDSGAVEETADFMMAIWAKDMMKSHLDGPKTGIVSLRLGKSRHGNAGKRLEYVMGTLSVAMQIQGDPLWDRAVAEIRMADASFSYEQAMRRHQTNDYTLMKFTADDLKVLESNDRLALPTGTTPSDGREDVHPVHEAALGLRSSDG